MSRFTLVLGGARSGKSRHAEELVRALAAGVGAPHYLATAQAWDDEMEARIATHRTRRQGQGWITHEAPHELAAALAALPRDAPVLIDCLTLWLTNRLLAEADLAAEGARLGAAIAAHPAPVVAVSNEVGLGIVPENALARAFRDAAGKLHQDLAAQADRVVLVVAGLPLVVKDAGPEAR
jgi:adenosylcobinamide kinase / adenosylcobinamide-phosphate guanylyltransferase